MSSKAKYFVDQISNFITISSGVTGDFVATDFLGSSIIAAKKRFLMI